MNPPTDTDEEEASIDIDDECDVTMLDIGGTIAIPDHVRLNQANSSQSDTTLSECRDLERLNVNDFITHLAVSTNAASDSQRVIGMEEGDRYGLIVVV